MGENRKSRVPPERNNTIQKRQGATKVTFISLLFIKKKEKHNSIKTKWRTFLTLYIISYHINNRLIFFGCLLSICRLKLFHELHSIFIVVYSQNKLVFWKHIFMSNDSNEPCVNFVILATFFCILSFHVFLGKRIFGSLLLFLYNKLMIISTYGIEECGLSYMVRRLF